MYWYLEVLKKYAVFSGRARRKEYWMFALVNVLISLVIGFFEGTVGTDPGVFGILYGLGILVPSIAVSIRRLHDTGRSGWWLLVGFIPLLGALALLVFMCLDSEPGDNRYGPNPKVAQADLLGTAG